MKLKNFLVGLTLSCFLFFTSGISFADTISFTDSFDTILTELVDQSLRVDQFDGSLGTLTNVSVSWTGDLSSVGSMTNGAAGTQSSTVSTLGKEYSGSLQGLASGLDASFDVFAPFAVIGEETVSLDPDETTSFGPAAITNNGALTPTDLTQFIGLGDFGYDFNTIIVTTFEGGGNFTTDIATIAGASLTVVYEYDAAAGPSVVPEPATVLLFGLGLLGFAHIGRRNNA